MVVLGAGTTSRQTRMVRRYNRMKIMLVLETLKARNYKYREVLKAPKDRRIAWMDRLFGKGTVGCRHRSFMNGRVSQLINPQYRPITIGRVMYTEVTKKRIGNRDRDDRRFECGQVFGDVPHIFETFAHFLDVCVYEGPGHRIPTDNDIRSNFFYLWTALRVSLRLRESDIETPEWMYRPDSPNLPNGIVPFSGGSWNGISVEEMVAHPVVLPARRRNARH